VFTNNISGFKQLLNWTEKLREKEAPVKFVVEATGVYHEKLARHLKDSGKSISIILPNKARHFAQTLKVWTVNDKESSKMLSTLGLETQLDEWEKPDPMFAHLKKLTREREHIQDARTVNLNELHAEEHSAIHVKSTHRRLRQAIKLQDNQIIEIEKEIEEIAQSQPVLHEKLNKICTIPGIGLITAITVVAECKGFNLFHNCKQLVCYAGYDVVEKESGTSVYGKSHISGKGNKHIRKAMHFPALISVRYNEHHKNLYIRLESKHGIKMKAYTAVQRKLLVLIYTLWNKDVCYKPEYNKERTDIPKILEQPNEVALTELVHDRSFDCLNLKAKLNNKIELTHEDVKS
jgi:transposase